MRFGVEKLVMKDEKMIAYLVSNVQSGYYQSETFGKILRYMTTHPRRCQLREKNARRSVVFANVQSIEKAAEVFNEIELIK